MEIEKLRKNLTSVDDRLIFKRNDPNDPRLGEFVSTDWREFKNSEFVLIGCPQDIGVSRNKGRRGAAKAPDTIREFLYRLPVSIDIKSGYLFDAGNIDVDSELEEIHDKYADAIRFFLENGKRVISLGGGNDLSYPDGIAMSSVFSDFAAVNVDAHLDIRLSEIRNSGTPYRQLIEEKKLKPENFCEAATQPQVNSSKYLQDCKDWGVRIEKLDSIKECGVHRCFDDLFVQWKNKKVMMGFDMDSVRASDAPGVSAIAPQGLTSEDAISIANLCGSNEVIRLFEVTEVCPEHDIDDRTSRLAALMLQAFLGVIPKYSL